MILFYKNMNKYHFFELFIHKYYNLFITIFLSMINKKTIQVESS